MRIAILCVAVLFACNKGSEDQAKEDMEKQAAAHPDPEAPKPPPPTKPAAAPVAPKAEEPLPPDPTNQADIEKLFKAAMNAQKDKDVLHYCELMKFDDKSFQATFGCTLSACRTKQADLANKYIAMLPKTKDGTALRLQAVKVCTSMGVSIN
jgi:hypothetical protein